MVNFSTGKHLIQTSLLLFLVLTWVNDLSAHSWMAPTAAAEKKNPVASDNLSILRGQKFYTEHCSFCHGRNAMGLPPEETGFSAITPDLTTRIKNHSSGDIFWKIETGRGDMPSFKDILKEEQIWDVINYIDKIDQGHTSK